MALERVTQPSPSLITEQVKGMGGYTSDEELMQDLPSSTLDRVAPGERKTPRGRKKKDEAAPEDPRLVRFKAKSVGLGSSVLIKKGFDISGKPLKPEENQDMEDVIYAISTKAQVDVAQSYIFMVTYLVVLLGMFIADRTTLGEKIKEFFTGKDDNEDDEKKEDE